MYTVELHPGLAIGDSFSPKEDTWYTLRFEWDGLGDLDSDNCGLSINNGDETVQLPLNRKSINGISYIHFISTSDREDENGLQVEFVEAGIN